MFKFEDLCIGDMFNTLTARWVKISETEAICVMSATVRIGNITSFPSDFNVLVLYSAILNLEKE